MGEVRVPANKCWPLPKAGRVKLIAFGLAEKVRERHGQARGQCCREETRFACRRKKILKDRL